VASLPPGLGPLSLRYAYGLDFSALTGGVGQTVAVVTEYGDSTAESDMTAYRSAYSLPACGSGCFSVVDENGGTNYPPPGPAGWSLATAQSLDVISAICPGCHILLVEAGGTANPGIDDLGAAENTAVSLGAKFVTNTWFTPEATFGNSESTYDSEYFDHPGVVITAPDGNGAGYGTNYPAASPDVIAVGGTTLTAASGTARGWTETAWSGTGSGCSPYEAKPSWQTDTGCTTRMLNDVAAVADPTNSPAAFFDTSSGGWVEGGGNDVASALVAAAFALAGTPAPGSNPASYLYAHDRAQLVSDITSGSGGACTTAYFCTAGTGYDGPTGVGSIESASALGTKAPNDTLTGGPAAVDPVTGSLYLFGAGTNGTVWDDVRTGSGSWSGWQNRGGTLKNIPVSAVYDPASNNLEAYGLSTSGHVEEDYLEPTGTWSGWKDLGGTFTGSPSAVYDPLDGALEVWDVGSTGTVFVDVWKPGAGWSGWQNKGGALGVSGMDAVYDPATARMWVFGAGTNGTEWGGSWTTNPTTGFSGWGNMSGTVKGILSALYDPASATLEVYGLTTAGAVAEDYLKPNGSWSGWGNLAAGTFAGWPSAVYDPLDGNLEVWDGNGVTAFVDVWTPGGGWSGWQNKGGALRGLAAGYDLGSARMWVFGAGTNGTVWGGSWTTNPTSGFPSWLNMGGDLPAGDL
jgi:hypothetical protein